ncbi:MAG: ATP-binding protein, partial [Gemmatimonadota bacterium]
YQVYRAGTDEIYPVEALPISRALRGELVYDAGIEIHSPEGLVPVEAWASPIRDASGTIVLALAAFGDISKRLESERQVKESERRLQGILDSIPLGITVANTDGIPTFVNAAGRKLLGRDITPGMTPDRLSASYGVYLAGTNQLYPSEQRGILKALKGEHSYADNLELRTPEGVVPLEIWSAPVYDGAGKLVMAISAYGEITDRRENQKQIMALGERLQNQVNELAAVNQELESFSYSVAHDLRAPLRAITGFSGMLLEDYSGVLDGEGIRLTHVVRDNALRMGELIDDLLAYSRLGRQRLSPQAVDMAALARAVTDDIMQLAPEGSVRPGIPALPPARGDATLLRQVWANLIGNALKYSRTQPVPKVEVGSLDSNTEPDQTIYFVKDNGVGFDMQYADKLFGVFQRLHRQDEFEGTGVGLAIAHRVITRHGGRIWADSSVGHGATFYFTLPFDREPS